MRVRPNREQIAAAYFDVFAHGAAGPATMREVARSTMTSYGSIYHAFASKEDLARTVDAGLATWTARELSFLAKPGDPVAMLQSWFAGSEVFALGLAFWISDRVRQAIKRGNDDDLEDSRGVLEGVCSAVATATGLSVGRSRALLVELQSLALSRFLLGLGVPTVASREKEWRAILDGPEPAPETNGTDAYDLEVTAIDGWELIRSGRHPDD